MNNCSRHPLNDSASRMVPVIVVEIMTANYRPMSLPSRKIKRNEKCRRWTGCQAGKPLTNQLQLVVQQYHILIDSSFAVSFYDRSYQLLLVPITSWPHNYMHHDCIVNSFGTLDSSIFCSFCIKYVTCVCYQRSETQHFDC